MTLTQPSQARRISADGSNQGHDYLGRHHVSWIRYHGCHTRADPGWFLVQRLGRTSDPLLLKSLRAIELEYARTNLHVVRGLVGLVHVLCRHDRHGFLFTVFPDYCTRFIVPILRRLKPHQATPPPIDRFPVLLVNYYPSMEPSQDINA